jgi:hypothetical protein
MVWLYELDAVLHRHLTILPELEENREGRL